jgi:hypothetical protein
MKSTTTMLAALCATGISFGAYAQDAFDNPIPEKNILHSIDSVQEKIKSAQDDKNVISDSDDREDSFIKSSENPLNDDAFDFNPDPDEARNF